VYSFIRASSF
jgi:hypothetical protein